ncbi:S41 family peptidase [Undibacterium crateris]|uniref:S41 family peptidase n=1 Tax=Undibacterium crateris TaxID=2528175 RepID=UPI001389C87B|nr:S41 family peptidase [Undibacterium crateris]NDI85726.1 hypothetical protein [Undibacterium crateris]
MQNIRYFLRQAVDSLRACWLVLVLLSVSASHALAWQHQTLTWPKPDAQTFSQQEIATPCTDCLLELRLPLTQSTNAAPGFVYLSAWRGQQMLRHYISSLPSGTATALRVLAWAPPETERLQLSFVHPRGGEWRWGQAQLYWLPISDKQQGAKPDFVLQQQMQRIEQQAMFAPTMGWGAWRAMMERSRHALAAKDRNLVLQLGLNLLAEPVPHSRILPARGGRAPALASAAATAVPQMQLEWPAPGVAYLALPGFAAPQPELRQAYADRLGALLQQLSGACGLILDLRAHGGGAIGPPLAGFSPLFEEGQLLGWWKNARGEKNMIRLAHGTYQELEHGKLVQPDVALAAQWRQPQTSLPLALVTGPGTASASEILAALLQQRPATRSFGEGSAGQLNGVHDWSLPDGARLALVTHVLLTADGKEVPAQFQPQQHTAAALPAAMEWLQSSCRKPENQ